MIPRLLSLLTLIAGLALGADAPAQAAGPFGDWAAIVVAGDWKAHSGAPSDVFDNARHDVGQALLSAGFSPANLREFSTRPDRFGADKPLKADIETIVGQLTELTDKAKSGCLVYFTSHGSPDGIVVGDHIWRPAGLGKLIDQTCGQRPTIAIISACFSGVFVPELDGPDRMVLTAARPDRASFGCGEADHYTFFDTCLLQSLPQTHDFAALGPAVQACVAKREADLRAAPASEPQCKIGATLRPMLPLYRYTTPAPMTGSGRNSNSG
ncbi:C13 family peptidase [Phenylobacterium montanum]|uniref:C13 family peptidase n=1 Tax=Phenylobacterium montanum TaxID=2823693 RepID=UPI002012FF6B|nr:C13 family peptidase [Caulobacter sp. S6]